MLINGLVGFTMMLTILFCLGDVDSVLETATGYPFLQVFKGRCDGFSFEWITINTSNVVSDSVKLTAGATAMGAIVLALTWACATGIITTASRMTWSFARDKGTPWATVISMVSERRRIPVVAVVVVTTIAAVLNLIYIGSSTAFNDVISLTITGFYCSYFLPAALLLYHRVKGHIAPHQQDTPGFPIADENNPSPPTKALDPHDKAERSAEADSDGPATMPAHHNRRSSVAQATLVWGPFHVPGLFGTLNNAYACVYMIFVIFWSVWPPVTPVSADT